MNQDYYEYIRQIHQRQYEVYLFQMEIRKQFPKNQALRKRTLLLLSDMLLSLGQRVRPTEFQVHIHARQAQDSCLEVGAEGC